MDKLVSLVDFDGGRFLGHLEAAYGLAKERWFAGKAPAPIGIA